jgi:hypothetical protein
MPLIIWTSVRDRPEHFLQQNGAVLRALRAVPTCDATHDIILAPVPELVEPGNLNDRLLSSVAYQTLACSKNSTTSIYRVNPHAMSRFLMAAAGRSGFTTSALSFRILFECPPDLKHR